MIPELFMHRASYIFDYNYIYKFNFPVSFMPVIEGVASGVRDVGGKLEVDLTYSEEGNNKVLTIKVDKPITNEHGDVYKLRVGDPVDYNQETGELTYVELADRERWAVA